MDTKMLSLTSELQECIATHLELEDLLMLGSTCQQFRRLVSAPEAESLWSRLYSNYWGATAPPDGSSAKLAFKMR